MGKRLHKGTQRSGAGKIQIVEEFSSQIRTSKVNLITKVLGLFPLHLQIIGSCKRKTIKRLLLETLSFTLSSWNSRTHSIMQEKGAFQQALSRIAGLLNSFGRKTTQEIIQWVYIKTCTDQQIQGISLVFHQICHTRIAIAKWCLINLLLTARVLTEPGKPSRQCQ